MEEKIDQIIPEEHYELTFLTVEEDISSVKKLIDKHGVKIVKSGETHKTRLAYPIKKKEYGFLTIFLLLASKDRLQKLSGDFNLDHTILRYALTKFDVRKENDTSRRESTTPREGERRFQRFTKRVSEPVLTNEALEKKIEEILK